MKRKGNSPLPNFWETLSPMREGFAARTSDSGFEVDFTIDGPEGCVPIHNYVSIGIIGGEHLSVGFCGVDGEVGVDRRALRNGRVLANFASVLGCRKGLIPQS